MDSIEEQCKKAAGALRDADVLLVVTGAGFSADSGLPVYGDIAKVHAYQSRGLEYADVSQPNVIDKDPGLFFGFWGQSFNDYRETNPHGGYEILARWRNDVDAKKISDDIKASINERVKTDDPFDDEEIRRLTPYVPTSGPAGAFHCFTSNVDAHFYDYFGAHEIHDCHGSIELWQCSSRDCPSGIWRAPLRHRFVVDTNTMIAPEEVGGAADDVAKHGDNDQGTTTVPRVGQTKGSGERINPLGGMPTALDEKGWRLDKGKNWPKCGHCGSLARPAVYMFGDFGWKYDRSQEIRWDMWREAVLDICEQQDCTSVCIVEIGCGTNVETCRATSEQMLEDVIEKGGKAKLVRINPDFPLAPTGSLSAVHSIPIALRGLQAIEKIDEFYVKQ
mmetsp:Transcript_20288/g.41112  ORF Transcript_20288/g.41112 Transcript_20288/m.41112 type:complete len:390 (-) Transcript_20288:242-1411(-)